MDQPRQAAPPARTHSSRKARLWRGVLTLGALAGVATGSWAFENTEGGSSAGLSGIFPSEVPSRLGADVLDELGPNWASWSQQFTEDLGNFYKFEGDVAAQRAALQGLKARLRTIDRAITSPQYRSIYEPLSELRGGLSRRIALGEAILDTFELNAGQLRATRLQTRAQDVSRELDALTRYLRGISGGEAWLPFIKAEELRSALARSASDGATVAAARTTLERLDRRGKIENPTQKEFLNRPPFGQLAAKVQAYLDVADFQSDEESKKVLRDQLVELVSAVEEYENLPKSEQSTKARTAFARIRKAAADGGDLITAALQRDYLNYNLRLVASETFLSKLLADARMEQGQVTDFILGASVGGYQWTNTTVGVNLKPSGNTARFDLFLNGNVQSNTTGVTDQATVQTSGNHQFYATKEVNFDGQRFMTSPGLIGVNANNTTTGISTKLSGVPIFGRIANRVATREVDARRPQSEAIAAQRIRDRVLPRFDQEVNNSMADAGRRLEQELFRGLRSTGLFPDAYSYQSTETELRVNTRLMADDELGGTSAIPAFTQPGNGAVMLMHDTLLNNSVDRMDIAGKTFTEDEFRAYLESFLSRALSRPIKLSPPPKPPAVETPAESEDEGRGPTTLVFAKEDPIRFRATGGALELILRVGFKQEGREDIPVSEVTAPLTFRVQGQRIVINRGTIRVADVEGNLGVATKGVIRKKIQDGLPERTVDAKFQIKGPNRIVWAYVTGIQIGDGWVIVNAQ